MTRRRRRTGYAMLSETYYRDDALTSCHPYAELLFVRAIAFCREQNNDGHFSDAQLTHYISVRIPQAAKHTQQLCSSGLWVKREGGYTVRSFLVWNESAAELAEERERERLRKAEERRRQRASSGGSPAGVRTDNGRTPDAVRTVSEVREEKRREEEPLAATTPPRADVESLCRKLADAVEANGSKRPTITQGWRDEARRLIDRDKRPLAEALRLIAWCQADSFWRANILSMPTFREKYDQLRLKAGESVPTVLEPRTGPKAEWR